MEKNRAKKPGKGVLHAFEQTVDRFRKPIAAGAAAVLLLAPVASPNEYFIRILSIMCMYSAFGLGLNILLGQMGLMSMGQAGFIGIGAYTTAILMTRLGVHFLLAALAGAMVAGVFGFLIGLPTLRLSGPYLAIVTIGFGEIMRMIFLNWESMTGGALGIKNIPRPVIFGVEMTYANYGFYYLMLAIAVLAALICIALTRSKFGRGFAAIKHDELAASMMGVEVVRYKIMGFVLSAMISGFVGGFYAMMQRYIDSNSFIADMSIMVISIVVTGGLGTIRGPILGAILLVAMPELFRGMMEYRFIVYGALLVVMMRVRPSGVLGWKSTLPYRLPKGTLALVEKEEKHVAAGS